MTTISVLQKELQEAIQGDIHFDDITRHVYSVDASIFEIVPLGVVIPKTKEDLIKTVIICTSHNISITVRGAATGITGSCLGTGIIIDTSKYLNKILDINIAEESVTCEPGVIQDELNKQLGLHGYRLGPDTSTGNRATLGGMLANNAAGAHSLRYGKMSDHILEVEMVLSTGELLLLKSLTPKEWQKKLQDPTQEGAIYRAIQEIRERDFEEIKKRIPSIPRRVSGYNLDTLIHDDPPLLPKIIAGSEGTFGIVTKMKLKIVPKPKIIGLCLIQTNAMIDVMKQIPFILTFRPSAFEMIDDQIILLGKKSPSLRGQLDWLVGHPNAIFILEFEGETETELTAQLHQVLKILKDKNIGEDHFAITDSKQISHVWALRKAGLSMLLSKRTYSRAIAFIEDISIPPHRLADFMQRFSIYLQSKRKKAGIYGHVGSGCMHIRPYIDLQKAEELSLMKQIMEDVAELVLEFGGALSGEHGDGLIRSWLNPKMFGPQLTQSFEKLKTAFDPHLLMNPGKIVFQKTLPEKDLRLQPNEILKGPATFLNFQREGSFELSVDLCNGNGLCRKSEGTMCPSFQATRDEFHTTRARAQTLRSIIHQRLPLKDLTSQGVYDVMDLCISCKGCKTECPSQVDMAKMKAEFLYHYHKEHRPPLRNYFFASVGSLNSFMSPFSSLFNFIFERKMMKQFLSLFGISPERTLPHLSKEKFSSWFSSFQQHSTSKQIVLFNDTFNEFNHPSIGQAAAHLFRALGYTIIVPQWHCCGRPAISKGFLKNAREHARKVIKLLFPYALQGIPIVGLEPSCILTIKDDYLDLIHVKDPIHKMIRTVIHHCWTFDEFIANLLTKAGWSIPFETTPQKVKVHGHCHQKALVGMNPTFQVLQSLPGLEYEEIPSGCCGMAGSFGYEKEHYEISMKIGELSLFPAIRHSDPTTLILANGTSCHHQISDGTGRNSLHLAEFLFNRMKK